MGNEDYASKIENARENDTENKQILSTFVPNGSAYFHTHRIRKSRTL